MLVHVLYFKKVFCYINWQFLYIQTMIGVRRRQTLKYIRTEFLPEDSSDIHSTVGLYELPKEEKY